MFVAPVNTGVPSGRDFDHDGRSAGPQDCFGYGFHPGDNSDRQPMLSCKISYCTMDSKLNFGPLRWNPMLQ